MGRSKKKSASKVAVTAPASSPVKPLENRKREAEVVVEKELVSAKKRKAPKNGKPDSESHSDRSGVEEVVVAPPPPSNGRSEEEQSTNFGGSSKSLVFNNIPYHAQRADLLEFFKSAGEVVGVCLFTRKDDDSFTGRGVVVFATAEEAQKALLELNEKKFLERPVKLSLPLGDVKEEKRKKFDGSQTLIFKNFSKEAQEADVLEFFKYAGEVVDVRLDMNKDGSFNGRGQVVFATAEEAHRALVELDDKRFLERSVQLFPGRDEKKDIKVECGGKTLFIKNLSFQVQKADVFEFFKPAGEVVDVRLAMRDGESFKGYAHIDFATAEQAEKALKELHGKKLLHRAVKLAWEGEKEGEESTGGKTLVAFNLSYQVQKADVLEFFKPVEGVVDVRLAMREADSFKGYGHVDFATAEQAEKALRELNGKKLLQRPVKLIVAREPKKGEFRQPFERRPEMEVFVTGFDARVGEDNVRALLMDHFASCGEIERVSIPTGPRGKPAGIAYVQFLSETARSKALELGTETMIVEKPRPRADSNSGGFGSGRGGGGRGPSKDTRETGANTMTVCDD